MSSSILVDTNVASYVYKKHTAAESFRTKLEGRETVLSFMSLAELKLWPLSAGWGARKCDEFEAFLGRFTIVYPDEALCDVWADVMHEATRQGSNLSVSDCWIAATAVHLDLPLATANHRHFTAVKGLALA